PLRITTEMVEVARKALPELSEAKRKRFMEEYGLNDYVANVLTADPATATYFEAATKTAVAAGFSKDKIAPQLANWFTVDLYGLLNQYGLLNEGKAEFSVAGASYVVSATKSPDTREVDLRVHIPPAEEFSKLVAMKQNGEIS